MVAEVSCLYWKCYGKLCTLSMPAKDIYHYAVRNALEKESWNITASDDLSINI
ncbi:element excision factor XisH family protein [Brasilonema sennae]|jgi:hypothetical protein|nr:element excision factor XisH family protein [Brasilonema sennae]